MIAEKRGRPRFSNQVKKPKTYAVTDAAADGLRTQARRRGISVSEMIEKLGKSTLESETAITERLIALLNPPLPIFWSVSAFVQRLLVQMHGRVAKEVEKQEIAHYLQRAMTALALVNYALPELYFRDLLPLIRMLCFLQIKRDAPPDPDEGLVGGPVETIPFDDTKTLDAVHNALELLRRLGPAEYDVLKMAVTGRLNPMQITTYKRLVAKQTILSSEVRLMEHQAILRLRDFVHMKHLVDEAEVIAQDFECEEAHRYYELCGYENLAGFQGEFQALLEEAHRNQRLKFWIEESDHIWGHRLTGWASSHDHGGHRDIHYEVQDFLSSELFGTDDGSNQGHLQNRLQALSPKLDTFASQDTIWPELKRCVEEELGGIPLEEVLRYIMLPLCGLCCAGAGQTPSTA